MSDINTSRRVLGESRTLAVLSLSADWFRPSYFAAEYMQEHGCRIIPVNPKYAEIPRQSGRRASPAEPAKRHNHMQTEK